MARKRSDNVQIQKKILQTLFSDDNIHSIDPFSEQPNSKLPQFYPEPVSRQAYQETLIQIVNECLKVDVGINYIVKVNHKLGVEKLLQLLMNASFDFQIHICKILQIYFVKLDSATDQYKAGAEYLITLLEQYMEKLQHKKLTLEEQKFLGQYLISLVNTYFEHFLKDIGMIALKMLSND